MRLSPREGGWWETVNPEVGGCLLSGERKGGVSGHLQTLPTGRVPSSFPTPGMAARTWGLLLSSSLRWSHLTVALELRVTGPTTTLSPSCPSPIQGWGRSSAPHSGLRCDALQKQHSEGQLDSGVLRLCPPPTASLPHPPLQRHFSDRAIPKSTEGLEGWLATLCLSGLPTAWKKEGPRCHGNLLLGPRRHWRLGCGAPQSCRSHALLAHLAWSCPLASAPALSHKGPSLPGEREPWSTLATAVFLF